MASDNIDERVLGEIWERHEGEEQTKEAVFPRGEQNPTPTTRPYIIGPSGEVIFLGEDGKPEGRGSDYYSKN